MITVNAMTGEATSKYVVNNCTAAIITRLVVNQTPQRVIMIQRGLTAQCELSMGGLKCKSMLKVAVVTITSIPVKFPIHWDVSAIKTPAWN